MPVNEKQSCKETSRAKFCINSFFSFSDTHSRSCIINLIQSGGLMECTIGDVNSKQCTACSLLLQRAVQFTIHYWVESACEEFKSQARFQDWVMWLLLPPLPACMQINSNLIMGYPWAKNRRQKRKGNKGITVNENGTRPKAKHTPFTWKLVPDRTHNFS